MVATKDKNIYIYYWATILTVIKVFFTSSELITLPSEVDTAMTVLIAFLFMIKIISQLYTKKQLIMIAVAGVLILYVSLICKEFVIMLSYLAIISMKGIDVRKVIKIALPIKVILVMIHIIIYCINFENIAISYYTQDGIVRHTLLLGHPNMTAGLLMWMIFEYIYLHYEKVNIGTYLTSIALAGIIYWLTQSRTMLIVFIIFIILLWIEKHYKNAQIFITVSRNLLFILSILVISLSIFYHYIPYSNKIDDALSRRITLGKIAIDRYGISILPQKVDYTSVVQWENKYRTNLVLDSLYTRSAVTYGLLILLILILTFHRKSKYITSQEALFIIMFAVTGITENYVLNAYICFPLLFLGKMIYEEKVDKDEIEKE